MTRRTTRAGLSLVEVLAATFIMGIGLISIFTLFPYGALQMASAFKDDRSAQAAAIAHAQMKAYWQEFIIEDANTWRSTGQEAFFEALDNPNSDPQNAGFVKKPTQTPSLVPPGGRQPITDPSYPVFADPMGWYARTGNDKGWVAEADGGLIPRRNLLDIERFALPTLPPAQYAAAIPKARALGLRTCSMLDGLGYDPNGRAADDQNQAAEVSGGIVQRELRYNWVWVLQRPNNRDRNTVHITVVVFDKRQHMFAPNTAEKIYTPVAGYPSLGAGGARVGSTSLRFSNVASSPPVRKGQWLMDGTTTTRQVAGGPGGAAASYVRNANFYRVVSVTEDATGAVDIELATPLKTDSMSTTSPAGLPLQPRTGQSSLAEFDASERQFVVLSGVCDVLDRNPLAPPDGAP